MRITNLIPAFMFFAVSSLGCDGPKSSLGELPDGSSSSNTDEGGDSTSAISFGSEPGQPVGLPCELDMEPGAPLLEGMNSDCQTGLCLYADSIQADTQQPCTESSECAGFGEGVICSDAGQCQLDPAHVAARSMCTDECQQDDDCVAADGTACEAGFACIPVTSLGSNCCQKFCACRDDFDVDAAASLAQSCAEGTTPGCCDQNPPSAACG